MTDTSKDLVMVELKTLDEVKVGDKLIDSTYAVPFQVTGVSDNFIIGIQVIGREDYYTIYSKVKADSDYNIKHYPYARKSGEYYRGPEDHIFGPSIDLYSGTPKDKLEMYLARLECGKASISRKHSVSMSSVYKLCSKKELFRSRPIIRF